jgi:thioredoxin-related protein
MKTLLLSIFVTFVNIGYTPFSSAIEKAKEENKEILLVFSGSDWCKPCINLKKNVFDQEEFHAYSNANLVFYVADFPRANGMLSEEQLKQNKELAEKYNLRGAFPYLVLLSSDQKIVKQHAGTFNSFTELKQWLEN